MSAIMPPRRAAAAGADVVDFPWASTTAVVDALNDVAATLTAQLEARPGMVEALVDWAGSYRDEFDEVYDRLVTSATGMVETALSRASSAVGLAEDTNFQQSVENNAANERAAERSQTRLV